MSCVPLSEYYNPQGLRCPALGPDGRGADLAAWAWVHTQKSSQVPEKPQVIVVPQLKLKVVVAHSKPVQVSNFPRSYRQEIHTEARFFLSFTRQVRHCFAISPYLSQN
jgi:hypothetical protein